MKKGEEKWRKQSHGPLGLKGDGTGAVAVTQIRSLERKRAGPRMLPGFSAGDTPCPLILSSQTPP